MLTNLQERHKVCDVKGKYFYNSILLQVATITSTSNGAKRRFNKLGTFFLQPVVVTLTGTFPESWALLTYCLLLYSLVILTSGKSFVGSDGLQMEKGTFILCSFQYGRCPSTVR